MSGSIVQSLKFWDRAMNATTSSNAISVSGANQFVVDVSWASTDWNGTINIEAATAIFGPEGSRHNINLSDIEKQNIKWRVIKSIAISAGDTPAPDSNKFWWYEFLSAASFLRVTATFTSGSCSNIYGAILGKRYM